MSSTRKNDDVKGEKTATDLMYLDATLRPTHFDDYIGQEIIKKNIFVLLEAAKNRGNPPEHVLLYGPP